MSRTSSTLQKHRWVVVLCDSCGEKRSWFIGKQEDLFSDGINRRLTGYLGWTISVDGRDLCPMCAKREV